MRWRIVLTNLWWFLCLQSVAEYRANVPSTGGGGKFLLDTYSVASTAHISFLTARNH